MKIVISTKPVTRGQRRRAFTVVELGASFVAVAMLFATLVPVLGGVRREGKDIVCLQNLHRIGQASAANAAADPNEFLTPKHALTDTTSTRFVNASWGGKSGVGQPVVGNDATSSPWGTLAGRGPATRPLNRILYGDVFPDHQSDPGTFAANWLDDTQLDLDVYRCPGDFGYTGNHYLSWRNSGLSSFDHYGNSYAVNARFIGVPGGGCFLSSNSPFLRPASRIPSPSQTILYMENSGRFANQRNYGIDGCVFLGGGTGENSAPIHGWHGADFEFNTAFCDGSVRRVFIDGHLHPQPDMGRYPNDGSYDLFRCVINRGPDWRMDTLPSPPVQTTINCYGSGAAPDPIG